MDRVGMGRDIRETGRWDIKVGEIKQPKVGWRNAMCGRKGERGMRGGGEGKRVRLKRCDRTPQEDRGDDEKTDAYMHKWRIRRRDWVHTMRRRVWL